MNVIKHNTRRFARYYCIQRKKRCMHDIELYNFLFYSILGLIEITHSAWPQPNLLPRLCSSVSLLTPSLSLPILLRVWSAFIHKRKAR